MVTSPILIVDDDETFLRVLQQALKHADVPAVSARTPDDALAVIREQTFEYAVLDLNIDGHSGLNLMKELLQLQPDCQVLILTGYASVASAVEAMRLGAMDYLCKPASVSDIIKALKLEASEETVLEQNDADNEASEDFQPMSIKRLEWEHIQKVLVEHDGNVSATAQALNMHRRTLQRKLQKRPVEK
ncbi:MAG: response regulator [Thiotrichales bacterium]|nr:response regulator [Thiotrichales bacterium]